MSDKPLTDITFSSLTLAPALLAGLEAAGFTRCTPIQAMTLPVALSGRDVAGQAQTGTGKTLAFLVAVVNRLLSRPALAERRPEDPRALILAPTRELAIQIHKDAMKFAADLDLKFALVYGGVDYDKQRAQLQAGADIIIATPGRLIDYVKQHKVVSLHACEVCVLDEADRMFDLGFIKDIRFLLRRMPARTERQTLLFSATLSHRVLELAYEHMNEPEKLVVETETITAERVRQTVYFPSNEEKLPLLLGLLSRSEGARTMVFVNTKAFVEKVARALEKAGYRVGVLSGDVPQKKRESLLARFQKGQLEILVATDVAARGLHIDGIKYVYNYDLPFDAEDYVHRIGRTARLGEEGDAISFACEMYAISLPDIEAYIEQKIPVAQVTPELMTALPRAPRPAPEAPSSGEADGDESIGQIFREVREQKAAERGEAGEGKPPRRRRRRRRGEPRNAAPDEAGAATGAGAESGQTRRRRGARSDSDAAESASAEVTAAVEAEAATPGAMGADPVAPRKRRRRGGRRQREARERAEERLRHGDRVDSRAGAQPPAASAPAKAPPPAGRAAGKSPAAAGGKPEADSLLGRIKRRVASLFKRPPSRH